MANEYWKIFASEVPSDLGIAMTGDQVEKLAHALEGAYSQLLQKRPMGQVTESIYTGKSLIVPLADVQHIEPYEYGLTVVTKNTKWNFEHDIWENPINVPHDEEAAFKAAWCRYRGKLEASTLLDSAPVGDTTAASLATMGPLLNAVRRRDDSDAA